MPWVCVYGTLNVDRQVIKYIYDTHISVFIKWLDSGSNKTKQFDELRSVNVIAVCFGLVADVYLWVSVCLCVCNPIFPLHGACLLFLFFFSLPLVVSLSFFMFTFAFISLHLSINSLNWIVCHLWAKCKLIYSIHAEGFVVVLLFVDLKWYIIDAGERALSIKCNWKMRSNSCFFFFFFLFSLYALVALYPSTSQNRVCHVVYFQKTHMNFSLEKGKINLMYSVHTVYI